MEFGSPAGGVDGGRDGGRDDEHSGVSFVEISKIFAIQNVKKAESFD